jgi:Fe-S-cluster-containing dehydrogenase component/CRP-like cAMP-binding protein
VSTSEPEATRWPSAVLDAPVLRGLDARAIREIEAAGRLRKLRDGDAVYAPGDGGEALFIVASGAVELRAVRRGEAIAAAIRTARPGDSFGEEPLVGASRRAGAVATGATVVAEIPVPLFRRAIGRSGRAEVAERLERTLRRALVRDVLRASAIGNAVSGEALDALVDAAQTEQASRGQTVYEEGERALKVYVVGEGLVQLQSTEGDRVRIRGYASAGDIVGHDALDGGTRRPARTATAIAMGPTLLVLLPVEAIDGVARLGGAPRDLAADLRRLSRDEDAARGAVVAKAADNATMHVFRDLHRLEVARSLLVIDLETCVRCGHCAWACGSLYGTSRLVRRGDVIVTDPRADAPDARDAREAARTWVSGEDPPRAREPGAGEGERDFDVFAPGALDGEEARPQKLLLPSSCQHCENPACLIDCPTGAIGKDPTGEVFIRDGLCTGCGACVRACPWDNVRLADRPPGTPKPKGASAELLAVKCDLCRTWEGGPACVRACPVEAISRIRPTDDLAELRAMVAIGNDEIAGPRPRGLAARTARSPLARVWKQMPAWAVILGAALATAGAAGSLAGLVARGAWVPRSGLGYASGVVAAIALVALGLYGVPKRVVRLWMGRKIKRDAAPAAETRESRDGTPSDAKKRRKVRSFVRPHYLAHLVLGLFALVASAGHAPLRGGASVASALLFALAASGVAGIAAALAYALLPRRLARLERAALLPEDFDAAEAQLVDRLHRELSGTSELVKAIAGKVLVPYAKHPLGPLVLFVSGHHLRDEEARLGAEVEALLEGRGRDRLGGLGRLVRTAVEMRALPAQRWVTRILRVFLPVHAVLGATALALLVFHLVGVLR